MRKRMVVPAVLVMASVAVPTAVFALTADDGGPPTAPPPWVNPDTHVVDPSAIPPEGIPMVGPDGDPLMDASGQVQRFVPGVDLAPAAAVCGPGQKPASTTTTSIDPSQLPSIQAPSSADGGCLEVPESTDTGDVTDLDPNG
jgi:hypothetical protein